jgi:hypothetical protein
VAPNDAPFVPQERKKELVDHREDSTFSFDPSSLNVKKLSKHKIKKIDARKGVLLSSYTRKKTRRRKRNRSTTNNPTKSPSAAVEAANAKEEGKDSAKTSPKVPRSVTPSPSPSPRHSRSSPRPQMLPLPLPPPKHVQLSDPRCPDTLHPSNTLGKTVPERDRGVEGGVAAPARPG